MDNTNNLIRQLPVSIEAEQALLGSIIVNPDSFDKVGGMISTEDFYLEEHKHIYAALLKMYAQNKTIDVVTLVNALVENGDRDEAGGVQYITLAVVRFGGSLFTDLCRNLTNLLFINSLNYNCCCCGNLECDSIFFFEGDTV